MNINSEIKLLCSYDYNSDNYLYNKSKLYIALKLIENSGLIKFEIQEHLKSLAQVFKKLEVNQSEIKSKKFVKIHIYALSFLTEKFGQFIRSVKRMFFGDIRLNDLINLRDKISYLNQTEKKSPLERFRGVVRKLQKTIAKGSLVKNSLVLDPTYWLETINMKLAVGTDIFKGHIYPQYLFLNGNYPDKWKKEVDTNGIKYQKNYSFEAYLNYVVLPSFSASELNHFKSLISTVEYYKPEQLRSLKISFDHGGHVHTSTPHLNAWVEEKKKNDGSKAIYSDFFKSQDPSWKFSPNPHLLKDQTYMYVFDHQENLYLQIKDRGKTNHTSMSNGHAVLAAGSLKIKNGKIVSIDPFSGHYKTTKIQVINFLEYLKKANVNIEDIKVTYVADYNVQPWVIKEVKAGEVQAWMDNERS